MGKTITKTDETEELLHPPIFSKEALESMRVELTAMVDKCMIKGLMNT